MLWLGLQSTAHLGLRKIYICPHALYSVYRSICHYNTYSFSKNNIHRNGLIWCPEIIFSFLFIPRYDLCLTHNIMQALSTVFLTPYTAGLISCGLRALPTKTLLLPDYKLGTNRPKFGSIFRAGCLLGGFFPLLLCCCFGFLAWCQPKFFNLILKQGMGNRSDLLMWKASGLSLNSSRGFVIWTINLQSVKAKSLCFDLCRKLPNMTKLLTSEKNKP